MKQQKRIIFSFKNQFYLRIKDCFILYSINDFRLSRTIFMMIPCSLNNFCFLPSFLYYKIKIKKKNIF